MQRFDSVVVGGGPAGLSAALYLIRSGLEIAVVEKLSSGGLMLKTEEIENYPGFVGSVKGYELADAMEAHLAAYKPQRIATEVTSIEKESSGYVLHTTADPLFARTVIICSGVEYRKLGVPGEEQYTGKGVSYCALCDGNFFRDQDVVVIGGGNTALEEALFLTRIVNKVFLVHRREEFRGSRIYQDKVRKDPKIELVLSSVVKEIQGDLLKGVTSVLVEHVKTKEQQSLAVPGVFVFTGFDPVGSFFPEGLELDASGFLVTDTEMHTSLPGIFAAGDIRSKHARQVVTAAGDGATAAIAAFSYLEAQAG